MSLVIIRKNAPTAPWQQAFASQAPDLAVHAWPETGPLEEVDYVLCWAPGAGEIARYPNLKAVFSLGAGVDHLLSDDTIPLHLPIVRMVDKSITDGMVQYVVMSVLNHHRRMNEMRANQAEKIWQKLDLSNPQIGIMGMGGLGKASARALAAMGYRVRGWNRSGRPVEGLEVFGGAGCLKPFLAETDILISLLPHTEETIGILNRETFAALRQGAYIINAGRGEQLVEEDLLRALRSGQICGAMLDVFCKEPLAADHPFWGEERVTVTPHIASWVDPVAGTAHVLRAIEAIKHCEIPEGQVDRTAGY
ncbi:glyoxylate/hydroxypyruvate reductase A [Rhizobium wenxiniae]|uniref:Glyoxylate/hydroxypyruvate reductase A n=1 Tax=Rhizobium wenxiniae TaxID=1737357 RepID=A0A7W9Y7W6_9HYPH|nr:glyoxylate/hydroxypyruvate reductase A [Rhizobium wenxiniae]MBB6163596.1 glyoxylate/hydroxypyruvate reductase A [Rhizobium wenxiniae]GGG11546.1 glyoxylate/hydroxypyruvate reductase A [Rhizobium wenxiniae]